MRRSLKIIFTISALAIIALVGIGWRLFGEQPEAPRTVVAERRDVVQDVTFTGRLQAKNTAQLSFEVAGTLTEVLVEIGDQVEAGQPIAKIDATKAQLEIAKARADQAATEEEARLAWQKTEQDWESSKAENARTLEKKRQEVRDAKAELDQDRATFQQTVQENGDDSSTTGTARGVTLAAETKWHAAQQALAETRKTVDKSNQSARAAADLAKAQYLNTKQTSPTVAGLSSLQASEALARYKLTLSTITAPTAGVVTTQEGEPGEYLVAGTTVATIETVDSLELKANVPETDAIKLAGSMSATVTFDAFPLTEQWDAAITASSPAAQIIEGVPTYEITLGLATTDQRFRPGLTANITVHAARREGVIAIPRRAIIARGTEQVVRILQPDGNIREQSVTTGLVGSDGAIEILSGLSEGEQVVTSTITEG